MQNAEQKTALIAMSGGVDSSIAAYLMRQADFRCMGTTMRLYRNEDLGACNFRTCCSEKDIEDASEVAFQLDIPYEVLDFTLDFQEKIIGKFVRTYEAGGTPNPCIDCNRFMKFDSTACTTLSRVTMPALSRTNRPAAGCSKRAWTRARTRAMCCTR